MTAVVGVTGTSGSGKTTLIEQLIACFVRDGRRVAAVKHAHHGFDLDTPGKDSYRMRAAGGAEVVLVGDRRLVLMREYAPAHEPELADVLALLSPGIDVVIVEGYKRSDFPKIEVFRPALGRAPLWPEIGGVVAVATDAPIQLKTEVPRGMAVLDLNDVEAVYRFTLEHTGLQVRP
ncbi:molybdopterin-guanine dinucleotide biosynthesis protein B [Ralstonia pseudosolanacearum]|uniref:molybdopterin-guanine dinucleotide biosynthesis protein B n=1 Tax=Ralstonia pseudosolanacearum TaxID=1310165 RepID=UPI000CE3CEA4|nr:molybdopterin-guanine dinucleotide biosynthesis protein B [Ralstonia pseudosolanacearum]MDO3522017.1 molybdopterin-guanine dinucleotide biosynthesis protein B [Ralstonia pseudosolanacearum]MDO3527829.1 molybdopterin-guanine dinucleotide biosynthesis protein B [Ralstonia pseudosolanacearum]MDO3547276.1 molybdopterin-guanine dinucleotide biosynthesis protein B [Ralstonia pseudosolanacearum]MDO3553268.1 molybdopterin-guanine dinucleotide biosynthesis protein B [Ralstonia pseudosolanacearum]MDO